MMNNSKTPILAIILGSILFGGSFAVGASSDRVEVPADLTRNFAYPKVDEIAPIAPEVSTTKSESKKIGSSVATIPVTTRKQKQHRTTPISRKIRVERSQSDVNTPVSPAKVVPTNNDLNDLPNSSAAIEQVLSEPIDNLSQTGKKDRIEAKDTQKVQPEVKQSQTEEKIAVKSSPEKSAKEINPQPIVVESPKQLTPEPPTPSEASE